MKMEKTYEKFRDKYYNTEDDKVFRSPERVAETVKNVVKNELKNKDNLN